MRLPAPQSTAVIILGASQWPSATQFEPSDQFKNSATAFREFLLDVRGFALPSENLLDLFDTEEEQSVLIRTIATFLLKTRQRLKGSNSELSDLIFYYVGHGGFDTGPASPYFLALRRTSNIDYLASSLSISSLRRVLREYAGEARRYLVLDCCFAAAALAPYLQLSSAAQGMVAQVQDAFPPAGTALLCASGAVIPAKAKRGAQFTMFSEAFLDILRHGVVNSPPMLSLGEIGSAIRALLNSRYGDDAARPEVHSPEQTEGDVAKVPIFRNQLVPGGPLFITTSPIERRRRTWTARRPGVDTQRRTATVASLLLVITGIAAEVLFWIFGSDNIIVKGTFEGIGNSKTVQFGGAPYCTYTVGLENEILKASISERGAIDQVDLSLRMIENVFKGCPHPAMGTKEHHYYLETGKVSGRNVTLEFTPASSNEPVTTAKFVGQALNSRLVGQLTVSRKDSVGNLNWSVTSSLN
jgi:hypothetical protein